MTLLTLLGQVEIFPDLDFDPETGHIVVTAWVPFGIDITFNTDGVIGADQVGGWLPERIEREHRASKKRQKVQAKRERRQDFVMRKIFAELRGLEPDERLLALMAEFETVEDLIKSDVQIQAEFRKAYFDFIIVVRQQQAAQDKEDETAIIFALSELL